MIVRVPLLKSHLTFREGLGGLTYQTVFLTSSHFCPYNNYLTVVLAKGFHQVPQKCFLSWNKYHFLCIKYIDTFSTALSLTFSGSTIELDVEQIVPHQLDMGDGLWYIRIWATPFRRLIFCDGTPKSLEVVSELFRFMRSYLVE